jgi:hypothetical protein
MEAGYEKLLQGTSGSKRVIRDGQRRIIEDIENIKEPVSGLFPERILSSVLTSASNTWRTGSCSWRSALTEAKSGAL